MLLLQFLHLKGMQDLKNLAQDIRVEVQDMKNSEGK
jgi:hypothetical protein